MTFWQAAFWALVVVPVASIVLAAIVVNLVAWNHRRASRDREDV